jgi:hypothetical protein
MDQHGRRMALRWSQNAMFGGGGGSLASLSLVGTSAVFRRSTISSTNFGKCPVRCSSAEMKVVEFRRVLCSFQPICDQRSLTAGQDCSHALTPRKLWFIAYQRTRVRECYSDWNSHLTYLPYNDQHHNSP